LYNNLSGHECTSAFHSSGVALELHEYVFMSPDNWSDHFQQDFNIMAYGAAEDTSEQFDFQKIVNRTIVSIKPFWLRRW
jgi:hypothetical protein